MQNSKRAISRRLQRLEQRFGLVEETREEKVLRARMEAGRLRLLAAGLRCERPPSPERRAELRGKNIVEILNAARQRAAVARPREPGKDGS